MPTPDIEAFHDLVRSGLENDEFSAHYQPKFDPDSEEVVGLEALLRWDHPDEGFQEAGAFMPAVERSLELVEQVDAWVLNTTTRQGREWLDANHDFGTLYVNISAWHGGAELVDMVRSALKETGFPAQSLALECPWRMLAADSDAIAPTMRDLRTLGCTIVLDGSPLDQACLDVVGQTPVQVSKTCIKSFQDFATDHGIPALASVVKAWRKRGVEIISIGVEHDDQAELSHKAGCRLSQGHRFKSPLPAKEVTFLLKLIEKTKQALSLI